MAQDYKHQQRAKRHLRIRQKITGTATRPRFVVFRSNTNFYVQIIDDIKGHTLVSCSTLTLKNIKNKGNLDAAKQVGTEVAKLALKADIKTVVFDRGGYQYHGKVKACADAAREAGLKF